MVDRPGAAHAVVRAATRDDVAAILAIHNGEIAHGIALWSDQPVTFDDRAAWLDDRVRGGFPVLIADLDGTVAGYASYGPWNPRNGYRFTVEDSVYLAPEFQGRGIGRVLLEALIARAKADGLHRMIADIEAGNAGSIRLHERLGFRLIGTMHEVGVKFGRWLDLVLMELDLDA